MEHKILVAFDDSENSMRTVDYLSKNFSKTARITLYSVLQDTAALCDMNSPELTAYFKSRQSTFCTLEDQKKKLVEDALQQAKEMLVSAGFDAHADDDMSDIKLSTEGFSWIAKKILEMAHAYAQGRIISVLEGGYSLKRLPELARNHVQILIDG